MMGVELSAFRFGFLLFQVRTQFLETAVKPFFLIFKYTSISLDVTKIKRVCYFTIFLSDNYTTDTEMHKKISKMQLVMSKSREN